MSHVAYPSVLPLDCIQEVIRIVRERKVMEEKVAFAEHAWNIQGYAQRVLIGTSLASAMGDPLAGCEPSDAQLEECATSLEEWKAEAESTSFASGPADAQLNPAVIAIILQYAPMVIALIRQLIEKRRNG